MSRERFYRAALWIPLAAPIALGAAALAVRSDLLLLVTVPFIAGLTFGGLGYVPFAVLVARRWRRAGINVIEQDFWLLPFLFAPFAALSSVVVMWSQLDNWVDVLWAVGNYGLFGSLVLGYFYLGIVRAIAARLPLAPAQLAAVRQATIGAPGA